jgi:hypothetical protein
MIEKQIENKLTAAVKKHGGIALKLVCPSFAGMPDRLILLPDGHIGFAELKAPGKKPRRSSSHATGCCGSLASRSMSLTIRSRLEG